MVQLGRPTHGDQGRHGLERQILTACYHPNFCLTSFGMLERCTLRDGTSTVLTAGRNVLVILSSPDMPKRDLNALLRGRRAMRSLRSTARLEETGYFYTSGCLQCSGQREDRHRLTRRSDVRSLTQVKRI